MNRLTALVGTDAPDTPGLARVYAYLGLAYAIMGDMKGLLQVAERGSDIAQRFDDRDTFAFTEQWRGYAIGGQEGITILDDARRLAEDAGNGFFVRTAWLQASDLYEQIGDLTGTEICYIRAIEVAELMGDPDWLSFLYSWHARNLFLRGQWEDARARSRLAQAVAPPNVEGFMAAYPPAILGQILLAEGEVHEGRALVEQSITLAERHHDTQALCLALPALAEHAVLTGYPEEAVALLESRLDMVRYSFFGHFCAAPLAGAYVLTGRLEEAERLLREQMEGENARTNRTALPGLLRVAGMMNAQRGRWAEAEALFLQAAEIAEEIGYPFDQAMTLLEHGRTAIDQGAMETARTKLKDALVIFERLDAAPYADRTRELLTRL